MLTNLALKALKPEPKPYKKSDGGGLFILVEANGSRLWRFTYRHKGKQKLLSSGAAFASRAATPGVRPIAWEDRSPARAA